MIEGFTKKFDPNGVYKNISEDHLKEMCGIVPNFFIASCMDSEDTLDSIAKGMDDQYGFGGFGSFAFEGKVEGNKYISPYEEDADMDALVVIHYRTESNECGDYDKFTMYQFESGIVGIEDVFNGKTKIARFD
jgi:hypothetical protein|tara:strand:+ start:139 stop:537 length:399 start_codon:yes stop_codon:yes gene_type:complete